MKTLLMSLSLCLLVSCATFSTTPKEKYPDLVAENVQKCNKNELWRISVLPMHMVVGRYESCVGVNDLLVIVTPTEEYSAEMRSLSAKLAFLHYMEYVKRNAEENIVWEAKLIKTQNDKEEQEEIFYYSLTNYEKK